MGLHGLLQGQLYLVTFRVDQRIRSVSSRCVLSQSLNSGTGYSCLLRQGLRTAYIFPSADHFVRKCSLAIIKTRLLFTYDMYFYNCVKDKVVLVIN
jgi:hypothetical protein